MLEDSTIKRLMYSLGNSLETLVLLNSGLEDQEGNTSYFKTQIENILLSN